MIATSDSHKKFETVACWIEGGRRMNGVDENHGEANVQTKG